MSIRTLKTKQSLWAQVYLRGLLMVWLGCVCCGLSAMAGELTQEDLADEKGARILFLSGIVSRETPGHAIDVDVKLDGMKELVLVVTSGGDNSSCDHADWAEARVIGSQGEKRLVDCDWRIAQSGWKTARKNTSVAGTPMLLDGKEMSHGIGTHASSIIVIPLPEGANRFLSRAGVDDSGITQNADPKVSSVQFIVFDAIPSLAQLEKLGLTGEFRHYAPQDFTTDGDTKPLFLSDWISKQTPGYAVDVDVDITGAKKLYLAVSPGGSNGADHVDWANARLTGPSGEMKLSDLPWSHAICGWKKSLKNKGIDGKPMTINGTVYEHGIGTHAPSLTVFDLPEGYTRFVSTAGLNDSGTANKEQSGNATVQFAVFTEAPSLRQLGLLGTRGSFVRFRVDALPEGAKELMVSGTLRMHNSPWVTKPFNLIPAPVSAPGWTPWVNLAAVPRGGNGPLTMRIPEGAKGLTQFAALDDERDMVREISWDEPDANRVILSSGLGDVRTFRDEERRYYQQTLAMAGGQLRPLTRPPLLFSNAWGQATGADAEYMVKNFRLLGMNSVDTTLDKALYETCYGWGSQGGQYAPPTVLPFDETKTKEVYDAHYTKFFTEGAGKDFGTNMRLFQLSDEPGEINVKPDQAAEGFRAWLTKKGLEPTLFGKTAWSEVTPHFGKPGGFPPKPGAGELFYWSRKYKGMLTPEMFGLACDAVAEHAPSKNVSSYVALSGHSLCFSDSLPLDMFELAKYPHMIPGISDWMATGGSWCWDTHQSVAFSVAPYNAGARRYGEDYGKAPISFPMMHCVWPSYFRAQTQIANQCKVISYYNYGPEYMVTEGFWSTSGFSREAVFRTNNRAALVDDILSPGQLRPSRVAVLYAMSTEYWRPRETYRDKRAAFLALTHEYDQPDLVTEDQLADGALAHYDALFVLDPLVSGGAQKAIDAWVRKGGLLWADANALTANEYNQPSDLLDQLAGIKRTFGKAGNTSIEPVEGEVTFTKYNVNANGRPSAVVCEGARVRARYADKVDAWIEKDVEKGHVVYIGHRAGLAYSQLASRRADKAIWPEHVRVAFTQPLRDAKIERDLTISLPMIMATPLSTEAGTVIPLYNMTVDYIPELSISLKEPKAPVSVQWFGAGMELVDLPFTYDKGRVEIPLPGLDWRGTFVIVRRTPTPKDPRFDEMRAMAEKNMASAEWKARSAGAWFVGFFPAWGLEDKLLPLLTDEHWAVRRSAAESIGRLKMAAGADALRKAVDVEKDDHALVEEIEALMLLGHADAKTLCDTLVASHNPFRVREGRRLLKNLEKMSAAE